MPFIRFKRLRTIASLSPFQFLTGLDLRHWRKGSQNLRRWGTAIALTGLLLITSCTPQSSDRAESTTASAAQSAASETSAASTVPASISITNLEEDFPGLPRLQGEAIVEMVVNGSPITIVVDGLNAPITAGNFVDLVNRGVYNGLMFHRVIRSPQPFVAQGGDPQSKDPNFPANQLGTGSFIDPATQQPRYIPLEIKPAGEDQPIYSKTFQTAGVTVAPELRHTRGAIAMARSNVPDSASAQFYFALADLDFLDGSYAVFGQVTEGMEVVDQIQQGDRISSATVVAGLENLQSGS